MDEKFKWIDFYTEFATELLNYKNNRTELINKIENVYKTIGIKMPKLENTGVPVDIDPFTVFGFFNKQITNENRVKIIEGIKKEFSVNADVPDKFDSIPVLNNQKANFFAFKDRRKEDDIENLWIVLKTALDLADSDSLENRKKFEAAYDTVRNQLGIKWNITIGLYWIRPFTFINLDSINRGFLSDKTNVPEDIANIVSEKEPTAKDYLEIRDKCLEAFHSGKYSFSNFPELSDVARKASSNLLHQFVERFIKEYPIEKNKKFADNEFGKYIRSTVPKNIFKTGLVDQEEYTITGSVGQGNWATIPMVSIFNKKITRSSQRGEYIVYLLSLDKKTLYITFNQGCTDLIGQHGKKETLEILAEKVDKVRSQIDSRGFSVNKIDLCDPGEEKTKMYEEGCMFSKAYTIDKLPSEEELRTDLSDMIDIYEEYIDKFSDDSPTSVSENKKAWLLTYNIKNWKWENFDKHCLDSTQGIKHVEDWACASKKPQLGDDVYLMKTGDKPRGIMAHGIICQESFEAPHYDPEKATQGVKVNKVKVEFDRILNFEKEKILDREELIVAMPNQEWSPMGSGVGIKDQYVIKLKKMWNGLLGIEFSEDEEETEIMKIKKIGLNTILYGPPGTGKTYATARYAVAICDPAFAAEHTDYNEIIAKYNELKAQNRIAFTTFHQSYSYEDFIEGIKPVLDSDDSVDSKLSYTIEPGVFKRFCEDAKIVHDDEIDYTGKVWFIRNRAGDKDVEADFEEKLYSDEVIKIENITDQNKQCDLFAKMTSGDWVVLGRNNTIRAVGIITDDMPEEIEGGIFHYQRKVKWKATSLNIDCRPINIGRGFSNFAVAGSWIKIHDLQKIINKDVKNDKPYVFIIDEINRGNISKIFGELITLIEDSKREGKPEASSAILPCSGETFSVPQNVYILGTMNTADRSIALMDTALRRRFDFEEIMPEPSLLRGVEVSRNNKSVNIETLLKTINDRIEFLFDREHTIGHASFWKLKSEPTIEELARIFKYKVIPLLQEYFYEDYEKIQLVLGDNGKDDNYKFIKSDTVTPSSLFVGKTKLDKANKYSINDDAFYQIESYIGIISALPSSASSSDDN